jgi:hypothetical protein
MQELRRSFFQRALSCRDPAADSDDSHVLAVREHKVLRSEFLTHVTDVAPKVFEAA